MEQRDGARERAQHGGTQHHSDRAADHTDPASEDTQNENDYAETTSMTSKWKAHSNRLAESDNAYLEPVPSDQERQQRGFTYTAGHIPPRSSCESTGTAQRAPTGSPATTRNEQPAQLPLEGSACSKPPRYFPPPVPARTLAACRLTGPPPLLPKPRPGNSRPPEKTQHDVLGTRQTTVHVKNSTLPEPNDSPRTVAFEVSGQPHPMFVYELYFKNRENAGGPIDTATVDDDKGVIQITFKSAEVAKAVCERLRHNIGGQEVEVKLCCPPKPRPNYQNKLLFQNVPEGVPRDLLKYFLESVTGCDSKGLIFGDDEDVVLATFDSEPADFDKVREKCKQKKLKETCLAVSKVPVTNCIMVENLATETSDCTIESFFENTKRSGGGPVQKVQRFPQRTTCLVFFEDYQVLDSLPSELVLGKKQLKVRPYFECLGSSGGTDDLGVFTIPENVVVKDKIKSTFLTKFAAPFEKLEQLLQPLHAQIGISEDTMTVECKLTPSVPKARSLAKTWAADVQQITADFLGRLQVNSIEVMQNVWPLVDQTVNQTVKLTCGRALIEPTQKGFIVAGLPNDVDTAADMIEGIIKAAEADIEHQKLVVEQTIETLKRHKTRLLSASLFRDQMRQQYPELQVDIFIEENVVKFHGILQDVKSGQVAMYELLQKEEKVTIPGLSPAVVKVIGNKRTKDYILSTFRKHGITAVMEVDQPEVCVYALSTKEASRAARIAKGSVLTTVIHLSPESSDLLYSQSKLQMLSQLIESNPGLDVTPADDKRKVFITATDDVITSITSEIKDFIENNTFYRQEVLFSPTRHRFISTVWNKRLKDIVDELKNEQVAMEADDENDRFLARGTDTGLKQLTEKLKALEKNILVHKETVDSEDRLKFLNSDKREKDFKELEKTHNCAVGLELETPGVLIKPNTRQTVHHHVEMGVISCREIEACFTGTSPRRVHSEPQLPRTASAPRTAIKKRSSQMVVTIVSGEIAHQQVDVIVNSTRTDLDLHIGAISSSILQAAGVSLLTECQSKYPNGIKSGEIAITKGHALACKGLYHLSLPSWAGPQTKQLLHQTTMECLAKCDKSGHTSIAIPALGTGNLSYPKDKVAQTMIGAVRQFERDNPSTGLREVRLVVYHRDTQTLQAFQMANGSPTSPSAAQHSPQQTKVPAAASQTSTSGITGGHSLPKIAVNVVKGEIAQEKTDIIVNSTTTGLDLSSGAVSSSILQAAGVSLQTECKKNYPSGIKIGEIAITKGYALGCKELYHLSLPTWAGPQTKQVLHQMLMECLKTCNQSGFTSIAIPALGTGILSYPRDEVAQTMIGAVRQFEQTCPSSVLKAVRLVVYHKDIQTVQAFQQAISQQPATAAVSSSSRPAFGFAFGGHLTMSVVNGEIAQQKVSVIVNSTTGTLDLSSGAVSSSILQAAGVSLQTECTTKYPNGIKSGEIAITKGHALGCKELYHLSLPSWTGSQTKQVLHQTVMTCLTKCNQSGFTSIAIPALGTGNLSYPRDEVAQTMIGAVRHFEQTCPSSVLREVKLVVYHKDTQTLQQFKKYQQFGVHQCSSRPSLQQPATNRRANRTFSGQTEQKDALGATSADYDWECIVMGVQVRVRKGVISEENATAILLMTNIADNNEDLADEALRSKCGKQLDEELKHKHADIEDKGVVVTGAPGLKCRFLVHIDAHRFSKDVSSGIKAALEQANSKYSARSVAISTLGIAPDKLGSELFKAMSQFFSTERDRSIREVRVILHDKLQIPQFKLVMEKHLNKQKDGNSLLTTSKRLFQAAKKKLSGTQTSSPVADERRPLASAPPTIMARKGTKLYIYAENYEAVNGFLEAFDDRVEDRVKCMDYTENALQSMKPDQIDKICKIAAEQDVEIKMWPGQGRYELKGLNNVLLEVQKRISDFVREAEHWIRESEKESLIKGMVQWSYLDVTKTGTQKNDYEPKENKIIETAFLDKRKTAEIVDSKGIIYVIDFDKMVEYPQKDPSKEETVQVIRKTRESDSSEKRLPENWEPHSTNEQVKTVKLKTTDEEYREVEDKLRATLENNSVKIVSVDRIQNVMLYQQYQAKKTNMDEQNGKGFQNERTLWHGTATDAIQSINNHGFNRSYCGKNATLYGQGVYFAVKSSYSTQETYSPRDSSGNRFLYQCKVLIGHPTEGTSDMRVLQVRQGHAKYDTATNDLSNPEMYVIFNDTQAYPEYLIKFT